MTDTPIESAQPVAPVEKSRLYATCLTAESTPSATLRRSCALLLAPYLAVLSLEWAQRVVYKPNATLTFPWQERVAPYAPLRDAVEPEGWGDLIRMARLPHVSTLFANGPPRAVHVVTDAEGFLNRPSVEGESKPSDYEIVVAGASFEVAGSDVDATFPAQLGLASGRRTYNAAEPGVGPVHSVLRLLEDPKFGARAGQVLVWGIIQRSLEERLFRGISRHIGPDGERIPASLGVRLKESLRPWLGFQNDVEAFLQETSLVRRGAGHLAWLLPSAALDLGVSSPVRVSFLGGERARPMLFVADEVASARRSFDERGGESVLNAIERVARACRARGVRLVIVLVPDKYEVFRSRARMELSLATDAPDFPERRAPAELADRLHSKGVEALDLYPTLSDASSGELLYRPDDTHWSDSGIRKAAEATAEYLGSRSGGN